MNLDNLCLETYWVIAAIDMFRMMAIMEDHYHEFPINDGYCESMVGQAVDKVEHYGLILKHENKNRQ